MEWRGALAIVCFALLLGCAQPGPQGNGGQNDTANTTLSATHTQQEIGDYLQKHLIVYYGLWNVEIPKPEYNGGKWRADVRVLLDGGAHSILRVDIDDKSLGIIEMWQKVFPNKEPAGIQEIPGKVSCSEGSINVMEFANPYCPNCVSAERYIRAFKGRFNDSVNYEYHVMLPSTNPMIEKYGYDNVSFTSKYYACAQNQSLLDPFRKCVMEQYAKGPGKPLQENWLDSCAIDNGLNMTELKACIPEANKLLDWDRKLGQTYLGTYAELPTFIIDCRFRTSNANLVRYAICYEYPETAGC